MKDLEHLPDISTLPGAALEGLVIRVGCHRRGGRGGDRSPVESTDMPENERDWLLHWTRRFFQR